MTTPNARLTVELVPSTAWWSNVRSNVPAKDWNICKRFVRNRSGDRCEVCGGRGPRWPVEAHEIWQYDANPDGGVQTLVGLIALCPDCHLVKHIGRAFKVGQGQRALTHLMTVNGWSEDDTEHYVDAAFELWSQRSLMPWTLDISMLSLLGITPPATLDREGGDRG